jgi:hypothetical protein
MRVPASRDLTMRTIVVPVLAFLLGTTVVFAIFRYVFTERPNYSRETGKSGVLGSSTPSGGPSARPEGHAKAWKLLLDGHLREAQDAFLGFILHPARRDADALRGLVAVRRRMAGDNPGVLRRQAAEYKDAISRGVETGEHYTLPAMEALVAANMQALKEIESQSAPTSRPLPTQGSPSPADPLLEDNIPLSGKLSPPATHPAKPTGPQAPLLSGGKLPPPAVHSAKATGQHAPLPSGGKLLPPATHAANPTPPPSPAPAQKGAPVPPTSPALQKLPAPPAPDPQTSPPPAASNPQASPPPPALALHVSAPSSGPSPVLTDHLYMVRVGPVPDRDRASAIAKRLSAGGFSQTRVVAQPELRVVSEPLPRGVAEGLVATLAGRGFHSQVEPLGGDAAQLLFGIFTSQKIADALVHRIVAAGYDAWVRGGTVYTLQLGPYPQASVNTITAIIKSGAPDAIVATYPVRPQPSPPPSASAPQPSPPPGASAQTSPPPPASAPQASSSPPGPSPLPNNRLYMVRVGPVSDRDRASAIAKQLSARGFAQTKVVTQQEFRVVSEPLPRGAAEGLAATLAGRGFHGQVEPLGGDAAQVLFGTFTSQKEAEMLAQRIVAAGYDAWVRGGTVYTLQIGPYPQANLDTIAAIIKSDAPDATVTTDPVP